VPPMSMPRISMDHLLEVKGRSHKEHKVLNI
jgi:hypothetical protein